jgi:hypothetical protein
VVGPIFFEEAVDGNIYQDIIITHFISLLQADECDCCLQQDGATCHSFDETMTFFLEFFGNHLISKEPPRSLDLSSSDFFLWGYLTGVVYRMNPTHRRKLRPILKLQLQILLLQYCIKCLQTLSKECMLVFMNMEHLL